MYFDLKQISLVLAWWFVALVVLAWEQSFSVPFLFFVVSLVSIRQQPKYYREALLILLGISFAGLYNFWFGVGIAWIFALIGMSYAIGHFLPALRVRITLTSLISTFVLVQVVGINVTVGKVIMVGLSIVLFWIVTQFVRWDVRSVPVSKANWGWQK